MILELDIGNSRIKWRHKSLQGDSIEDAGTFEGVDELTSAFSKRAKPDVFRFCNVRDQSETESMVDWSRRQWELEPQVAEVVRECGGVTVNYPDVSRLGVDRWLAMLAAYRKAAGACLVVDSGTAFTLDAIAMDGSHLGGFILPGLNLMQDSLEANTGIRLSDNVLIGSTELGNSTDEAVINGSTAALVALTEKYSRKLQRSAGEAKLFFSGGDAEVMAKLCEYENLEIVPELVLDGLAIACPSHKESPV